MFGGLETVAGTSRKKQDTGSRKKQAGTAGSKAIQVSGKEKRTAPAVNENSFMGTEVAIIVSLQYRYFCFEQFGFAACRKFSAIDSAWRIRRDGVSGAIPFIYGDLVFIFQTEATRKP